MHCGRVAIGLKGASEARLRLSGGKPRDAATSTGAGHDLAARHDGPSQMSQMPCSRVAIGFQGGQRPAKRGCVCREANQWTLRPQRTRTGIYL